MALGQKEQLIQENGFRLEQFKLSDQDELTLYPHAKLPGYLYAKAPVTYTKTNLFDDDSSVQLISRGDRREAWLWHATPEEHELALRYGIVRPQALTAQASAALGVYHQKSLSRLYDRGIRSNKFAQKAALVNYAQERIKLLRQLENLVNSPVGYHFVIEEIQELVNELNALQASEVSGVADLFTAYDSNVHGILTAGIHQSCDNWQRLRAKLTEENLSSRLSATGYLSIMQLIKNEIIEILRETQQINQNLTYSGGSALLRGDLNGYCEDALKVVRDYEVDHHSQILPEHQGIFTEDRTIDLSHLLKDPSAARKALMAITQIKNKDAGLKDRGEVLETRFTKWRNNASGSGYGLKRPAAWVWNMLWGSTVGLVYDLLGGLISPAFGKPFVTFTEAKWTQGWLQLHVDHGELKDTEFLNAAKKLHIPKQSIGSKLGLKLGNLVKNVVWETFNGIAVALKNAKVQIIDNIYLDYLLPRSRPTIDSVFEKVVAQAATLKQQQTKVGAELGKLLQEQHGVDAQHAELATPTKQFAVAPYALSAGEWDDPLNTMTSGLKVFLETFTHHIHAKNPFTGLLFNVAYAAGGFAVLSPKLVAFMGKGYIHASQTLGNVMAHGKMSAAVAGGFMQAKMVAGFTESILHGSDSWLSKAATTLEKDPSDIIIYSSLAVGLGYMVAYYLNIPWLSEHIREDLGDFPLTAMAFAGAKIGVLMVELLEAKHAAVRSPENEEMIHARIHQALTESYCESKNIAVDGLSVNDRSIIEDQKQNLLVKQFCPVLQGKINQRRGVMENLEQQAGDIARLRLLTKLELNAEQLPHLDHQTKRELLRVAREEFKDQPQLLDTLKQQVFPKKPQRMLFSFITIVLDYVPMVFRCIISLGAGNMDPYRDLGAKVAKDITRVGRGIKSLVSTVSNFSLLMLRGVVDIVSNEIFARVDSFFSKKHSVSSVTYAASKSVDTTYADVGAVLATPVHLAEKAVTHEDPKSAYHRAHRHGGCTLFAKQNHSPTGDHLSEENTTLESAAAPLMGAR